MGKSQVLIPSRDAVVLGAVTVGLFHHIGKRFAECKHANCGFQYLREAHQGCYWIGHSTHTDIEKHQKAHCKPDWCVVYYGRRPSVIPKEKKVKCKKTYFQEYTPQELSDPTTKVELAAISLDIAEPRGIPSINMIAVYNLMADNWDNDDWWTLTPKRLLAPNTNRPPAIKPKDIYGIQEVITKLKENL